MNFSCDFIDKQQCQPKDTETDGGSADGIHLRRRQRSISKLGQHRRLQCQHGYERRGQRQDVGGIDDRLLVPAVADEMNTGTDGDIKGVQGGEIDQHARIIVGVIANDHEEHHSAQDQVQHQQQPSADVTASVCPPDIGR